MTKNTHLSVAIIPFKIEEGKYKDLISGIQKISQVENFTFFNSKVYHKYVENLITKSYYHTKQNTFNLQEEKAFLTVYKINQEHLKIEISKKDKKSDGEFIFKYDKDKHILRIDHKWTISIFDHTYVVINKTADYGYFVLGINMIGDTDIGLEEFQDCEFFRFHDNENKKYSINVHYEKKSNIYPRNIEVKDNGVEFIFNNFNSPISFNITDESKLIKISEWLTLNIEKIKIQNKYKLILKKVGRTEDQIIDIWDDFQNLLDTGEIKNSPFFKFTLMDYINSVFRDIDGYYQIKHEKPVLLHLFNQNITINEVPYLEKVLYKTLRIPPILDPQVRTFQSETLITTQSGVSISATIEGASIIDSTQNSMAALFNKYFPAFILVLNQREVMIDINERISQISYKELTDFEKLTIKKLEDLKELIQFFKFKQVIFSISFYDEISIFYKKLFKVFDIQLLLEDNQESVKEIHTLLSDADKKDEKIKMVEIEVRDKKQEVREKKQAKKLEALLSFISVMGIFSLWVDVWELYGESKFPIWYICGSLFISMIVILFIVYNLLRDPNQTAMDNLKKPD